jgi:hypothetical protein
MMCDVNRARNLKDEIDSEDYNGSQFQKFVQARKYKRLSKKAYKVVKVNLYYQETGTLN